MKIEIFLLESCQYDHSPGQFEILRYWPWVFRVGYNEYKWERLSLLADKPGDWSVQLVGVALVEVEGRYSEVLPHQARHVHVVQRDGGHLPGGGQEFRNEGGSDQIGGSTTVLGQA